MKKLNATLVLILLIGSLLTTPAFSQDNVIMGLDGPAYGVKIKVNYPSTTSGFARGFHIVNEDDTENLISFGAFGRVLSGQATIDRGWIGTDYATTYMDFLPNGNVGIGIHSPSARLHVVGGTSMTSGWNRSSILEATYPTMVFNSDSTKWGGIGYDKGYGMRFFLNATSGDVPASAIDPLNILNSGNVGIGVRYPSTSLHINQTSTGYLSDGLRLDRDPSTSSYTVLNSYNGSSNLIAKGQGNTSGILQFMRSNGVSATTTMLIDSFGHVGIGTMTPTRRLEVASTSGDLYMRLNAPSSQYSILEFSQNGSTTNDFTIARETGGKVYFQQNAATINTMVFTSTGNIGIGLDNPGSYKLNVCGNIRANEVKVNLLGCDFVFEKDYKLMSLTDLEKYISVNKHLPEIEPAIVMEANGTDLGNLNSKLLQKVEELTLYVIELKKQNEQLSERISSIEKQSVSER